MQPDFFSKKNYGNSDFFSLRFQISKEYTMQFVAAQAAVLQNCFLMEIE